ncbi:MAG TPA: TonB family protein, partial [Polyangiaceae bacterium]|nr:TonB family protein [Polyangiaceae bacterium]
MPAARPESLAALLLALSVPVTAAAQDAAPVNPAPAPAETPLPSPPASVAPQVYPPTLIEFVEAEYPEAARAAGVEGTVVLTLDIDAEGRVTAVAVVSEPGLGLGTAAQSAALRFRFAPARRGDTPLPSRIAYRYEFRLPRAAEAAPVPPPTVEGAAAAPAPAGVAPLDGGAGAVAPAAPVAAATSVPAGSGLDVTARGDAMTERLRASAESVTVVETERAQRESADLGEVLARTAGVGVRRSGGLGSDVRFSLQGLSDDQVRFFIDGLPLEYSGYPFGIGNVPVNSIERVEIYAGVVPVRFGADALGGAVNLVTAPTRGTRAAASYEAGSFGVQRASALAQVVSDADLFARIDGFFDLAKNDYPIDVEVPDESGRLTDATVYRFHDNYRAVGGGIEAGVLRQPWAKRLSARVFATDYDKDFQHNAVMTVPYGEVTYGETVVGGNVRYEQTYADRLSLDAVAGYSYGRYRYVDVATCVYDWFGRCVTERTIPGEREGRPQDQLFWDHTAFGRANLT